MLKKKKIALGVSAALAALAIVMGGEVKDNGICISFPSGDEPAPAPSASAIPKDGEK